MNRRAIFVALILSIVVSYVLWNKIQTTGKTGEVITNIPPKLETKALVVAKKRVPVRTRVEAGNVNELFEMKDLLASEANRFPDAFTAIASLTGRFTAVTILQGDVITNERMLADDAIPDLAHAIPEGRRAVSIAVSKVSGVGGFIEQGNFVDVIAMFKLPSGEAISKIVLQDILVLAVGGMYQFDGTLATAPPAIAAGKVDLVTMAVTPEELERLMYLDSGVTFRLVLKNPKDKNKRVETTGATEKAVMKGLGIGEEEPAPQPVARPIQPTIPPEQPTFELPTTPVAPVVKEPPAVAVTAAPKDDGKVEIWYGSSDQRKELIRETLPTRMGGSTYTPVAPTRLPSPTSQAPTRDIAAPGIDEE
ncbi:MAG: Flp pilus assembly protein CpaB [Candidatus Riflebacteria bacterium]|nr:Flp pilus assembly protein CpaB [Candidatus Riflebacteria bacterium]